MLVLIVRLMKLNVSFSRSISLEYVNYLEDNPSCQLHISKKINILRITDLDNTSLLVYKHIYLAFILALYIVFVWSLKYWFKVLSSEPCLLFPVYSGALGITLFHL